MFCVIHSICPLTLPNSVINAITTDEEEKKKSLENENKAESEEEKKNKNEDKDNIGECRTFWCYMLCAGILSHWPQPQHNLIWIAASLSSSNEFFF